MYFSMNSYNWSQSFYILPPRMDLNTGPPMTQKDFSTPPPPYPLQDCRDEVESIAPRSDAIVTHCGVIRPENLIWDPPNLKELGPLKFVGVYNLSPAFWPSSLKDNVRVNLGIDVDGTNRADDSRNIKNPSSFVPYDVTSLFENLNFSTPSHHANGNISDISGLSVDENHGQTEIAAITGQGEDKHELSLSPGVMEAAATDSDELLSYFTGSRRREMAIDSGNDFSPAAAERFEMHEDFELLEPLHLQPRLDSYESFEDVEDIFSYIFSDESTAFYK